MARKARKMGRKATARAIVPAVVAQTQTPAKATPKTPGGLYLDWLRYLREMELRPRSIRAYTTNIGRPPRGRANAGAGLRFLERFGRTPLNALTREAVMAWRDDLRTTYEATTVRAYVGAARLFCRWLLSRKLITSDVMADVKGARVGHDFKKDYLTPAQAAKVLHGVDDATEAGRRDKAIIALMATSGLRTIEVARANVADFRRYGEVQVLYVMGKGRDDRQEFVAVAPEVKALIDAYLSGRPAAQDIEPLFVATSNRSRGGRLSTRTISAICKRAMVAAGLDSRRLTAHSLRHTAATLALRGGRPLDEIQQMMRHSNIGTTMIYAETVKREDNLCAATTARAIFNAGTGGAEATTKGAQE